MGEKSWESDFVDVCGVTVIFVELQLFLVNTERRLGSKSWKVSLQHRPATTTKLVHHHNE